ncbi:MAG: DUF1573 domain-containing protein [Crocinitomicaceae bacterium]|nr:DUF1573 domain-containing protein [Crocinitomicaceae bacterium]
MKKSVLFGVLIVALTACGNDTEIKDMRGKEVESTIAATPLSQKELDESLAKIRAEEEEKERKERESQTTLEFDKLEYDFGNVKAEFPNEAHFKVTNTGDKPLVISNIETSCGCTTSKKPEKPILPGKSDDIIVTFKSNPGQSGEQQKTVTVSANTAEKTHQLKIRAFVK